MIANYDETNHSGYSINYANNKFLTSFSRSIDMYYEHKNHKKDDDDELGLESSAERTKEPDYNRSWKDRLFCRTTPPPPENLNKDYLYHPIFKVYKDPYKEEAFDFEHLPECLSLADLLDMDNGLLNMLVLHTSYDENQHFKVKSTSFVIQDEQREML